MTRCAFYKCEFGYIKIGYTDKAISYLKCVQEIDDENISSDISNMAFTQLQEYFEGQRKIFDFPYELQGTIFQKKVWEALCEIPYGEVRSYKDIAIAIGNPKASRAIGMANHHNPIWIAVPCHRVVGANGKLTGYAGGLAMKETLLELERKYYFESDE